MKTDERGFIVDLGADEVFVFGSNLAGIHGAGAAKTAHDLFGAPWAIGKGRVNEHTYAIPTKDEEFNILAKYRIEAHVDQFIDHAKRHPNTTFHVTRIGCGYAKYEDKHIAPLFTDAPDNVLLPPEWADILDDKQHWRDDA